VPHTDPVNPRYEVQNWSICTLAPLRAKGLSGAPSRRYAARPLPTAGHGPSRLHPVRSCRGHRL